MSDLQFPTPPTLGEIFERWQWTGRSWDPLPQTPYVPLAGNVAMTGPIYYTGPFVLGTSLVNKDYVDQAVSQLQVFEGAWDVAANQPDLTLVAVPTNGSYYIASTAGTAPAALPGIGGQQVRPGDMVVWQTGPPAEWAIIPGAGMTQAEADVRYLQLAGGTLTGTLTLAGNAAAAPGGNLQPVPLQQLNAVIADYVQKAGDTMTGTLAITGGTPNLNLTGNAVIGGTLGVTGNTTITGTLGITGLTTAAALTSTAVTNLATTSGAVTIGSAANNALFEARGTTNLSTIAGATTVGSATNNAAFTARGNVTLSNVTGNATVGGTALTGNSGSLTVIATNLARSVAVFEQYGASQNYNQGIRINRASSTTSQQAQWGGIILGGAQGSAINADAMGDGAFSVDTGTGAGTGTRVNARATWWVASNPQGDFVIDQQGTCMRTGGLTAAQNVTATTPPSWSTGFYIRRSDNQCYVNGYPIGHTRWRNYLNQVTLSPGLTWYQGGSSYIIADDSEVRMLGLINYTSAYTFQAGNHANVFVLPVALRPPPGVSSYYPPATIFSTGTGVGANSRLFAGYMGIANNGQVTVVASSDVITYNTNGGYIMFCFGWFIRSVPNA